MKTEQQMEILKARIIETIKDTDLAKAVEMSYNDFKVWVQLQSIFADVDENNANHEQLISLWDECHESLDSRNFFECSI